MNTTKRSLMTLVAASIVAFAAPVQAADNKKPEAAKTESPACDSPAGSADDDIQVGTRKGMLRFSGGPGFHAMSDASVLSLHGEFEYMVTDNVGIKGVGYIPLGSGPQGVSQLPGYLGMNIHFMPRSRFDIYIGGGGGGAIASEDKHGTKIIPGIMAGAGAIAYLFSVFYVNVQAGYELKEYATNGFYADLSSPYVAGHGGFYF
jgi:hypothetical protein